MEAREFSALRVSLASPEQIREWSYGEVTKPETINYRRLRPEKDGLFCEAIFGPTRDWQCYCGKYKNIRYRGIICDKCGVEVTRASVRRERMGHIELAAPVAHVWYTRRVPSYLGLLLDISRRNLDRVLYFAQYVVTAIDEEARNRALARIDKELQSKEREMGGDIEEQMQSIRGERDEVLSQFEDRAQEINQHFDEELARLSDRLMGEAQAIQQRIETLVGQVAPNDINFESTDTVIVAKGEMVTTDHISQVQNAVNQYLNELQAEIEEMRQQELDSLDHEADSINDEARRLLDEHLGALDDRMRNVRAAAEKARQELKELHVLPFLSETRYRELKSRYGTVFEADMGAEAFYKILQNLDLDKLSAELWQEVRSTKSKQRKKKATKRLRVVESLRKSSNRPEWMILTVLPVIPPDLRPMVQLDGGRFATSDLNDLYRRVINRNNRLKHLLELGAPDVIVRNEKRMLQEAVDSLIDNSQRGKALSRRGRRELKSLSDMLKGKKGRFRRNLLGKRVDYSGRSVIVIGPKLKLHQCGLPKTMALELYRPFVISRLVHYNYASNVKGAKRIIEREKPEVWEVLEEVIKERPVLLNRAPTLHRLGIQAFEPQLVEGKAIQIHPLVCSAFNADFDGDQMAVHVPLSEKAVQEARERMLSTKNLLKPADGQPIVGPAKDMVLGNYYLTMDPTVELVALKSRADEFRTIETIYNPEVRVGVAVRSNGFYFALHRIIPGMVLFDDIKAEDENGREQVVESAFNRAVRALHEGDVDVILANAVEMRKLIRKNKWDELEITNLHERRLVVDMDEVEYLYNLGIVKLHTPILLGNVYDNQSPQEEPEITTVGRAIFNRILPDELRFVQETMDKKALQRLVARCYQKIGSERTTDVVDDIKNLGFYYATISGTTIAVHDLTVPEERERILAEAEKVVERAEQDFRRGLTTEEERYQITIDEWTAAKDKLQDIIKNTLDPYGPIAIMAISGSTKGGFGPITQLAGMRGLMADPSGRIIDLPITSHFRKGLTALEYFISTHGARKGLADTALRTADAGYLTRRLVDVAQDVIVNRLDCGTHKALWINRNDDIAGQALSERIVGRCAARDIHDPQTGELIVARNGMINEDIADSIENSTIDEVPVRSPMTCDLIHGICALCYGRDLGTGEMVEIGSAVGIVAAQSIGEPGTQLTLRTFHTGGTAQASGDITTGLPRVEELFEARKKPKGEAVMTDIGGVLRISKRDDVRIATVIDSEVFNEEHTIPVGWEILVEDEARIKEGTEIAKEVDGDGVIIAKMEGTVHIEGHTIYIRYERRRVEEYEIPSSARWMPNVYDGCEVYPGQQLTEGSKNPHRILRVLGADATQKYLLTEVQKVYRNQGVNIADKHFEIMIRKMLSKVQITRSGDSDLLPGELIDRLRLLDMNEKLIAEGKEPAAGVPILLGITKAALNTDSFLSASSFQHTIKVLAGAAIEGKVDNLYGLKENVIIGKLIPAGTGFHTYQDRELIAPNVSLEDQGAYDIDDDDAYDDDNVEEDVLSN
ncbi:MAG: DNA-directed RNA polymerase subunit beta' [Phototrophicales bacterium]|nr:MAG: DNA-directed RNA polymerase subunit beta' [Phototrophicales bacterium]